MFPYKTQPFQHQRDILNRSAAREFFAIHLEQGLGKSKIIIDNVAYLYMKEEIDGVLIIAPNGVHTNWANDEIPAHMSERVAYFVLEWSSSRAGNKGFAKEYETLLTTQNLAIFCVNIDAIATERGKQAVRAFLKRRRVMTVLDESDDIKSPGAKRSRAIHGLTRLSRYRRNLTGTPVGDGSPFDIYSQFKFLEPSVFGTSFTTFKNTYAEMEPAPWYNAPPHLKVVKRYKNLDKLREIMCKHSVRLTKDELIAAGHLDIPDKLYSKRYVELSREQNRMYKEMEDDYITQLQDSGEYVSAVLTLTRYLRLQQILMGYVPVDSDEDPQPVRTIPGDNPRLNALEDYFEKNPGKIIIWARFRMDLDLIQERFTNLLDMVRYDGTVGKAEKEEARERFQNDPDCRVFLANPQAAGRGLTLNAARHTLFYSNYFSLRLRLQAEDRQHRIGLRTMALYTDFIAKGTVDIRIVRALRSKKNVSDTITGDPSKDWI